VNALAEMHRWFDLGTEWVKRMWVRDERTTSTRRGAGEHRWTWIWLGKDANDADIDALVRQVQDEITGLPMPLGISDFMLNVSIWGPRRDGQGEDAYLAAQQTGDDLALQLDLSQRGSPKVIPIGEAARGHVIDRQVWRVGNTREELRRALRLHRPCSRYRIVRVGLFGVGEAYLKLVAAPSMV
jgi:hypothetical protein